MFYFKQDNIVKQELALEMAFRNGIFSEPCFDLVVSIVYIVLHYEVLLKK